MEKHKEVFFTIRLHSAQSAASLSPICDPDVPMVSKKNIYYSNALALLKIEIFLLLPLPKILTNKSIPSTLIQNKEFLPKNSTNNPPKKNFPKKSSKKIPPKKFRQKKLLQKFFGKIPKKCFKKSKNFQKFPKKFYTISQKIIKILKISNSLHRTWRPKPLSGLF